MNLRGRMRERPLNFEVDYFHPYAKGLVFAALGNTPGGLRCHDSSVQGYHGTLTNMETEDWVWDKDLNRFDLSFGGTNEIVSLGKVILDVTGDFSMMTWCRPTTLANSQVIMYVGKGDANGFGLMSMTGPGETFGALLGGVAWKEGAFTAVNGTLYHVAAVRRGTTIYHYTNGVLDVTWTSSTPNAATNDTQIAGDYAVHAYLVGQIADALMYDWAVPDSLIAAAADRSNADLDGLIYSERKSWRILASFAELDESTSTSPTSVSTASTATSQSPSTLTSLTSATTETSVSTLSTAMYSTSSGSSSTQSATTSSGSSSTQSATTTSLSSSTQSATTTSETTSTLTTTSKSSSTQSATTTSETSISSSTQSATTTSISSSTQSWTTSSSSDWVREPAEYSVPAFSLPANQKTVDTTGSGDYTSLQDALDWLELQVVDSAIILTAGQTWTCGPITGSDFILDAQASSVWKYIVSSAYASLPAEGTRVGPSDAANMAKITCTDDAPWLATLIIKQGVDKVRLTGIELATGYSRTDGVQYGVLRIGYYDYNDEPPEELGTAADQVIIDRCYVHGTDTGNNRDGIVAYNVTDLAVKDSYVSNWHGIVWESHGIHLYGCPGPALVDNNYIEGAGINLFIGDSVQLATLIPSDITVSRNWIRKPWATDSDWAVKNVLEVKNGVRILIEGNLLDRAWEDAQLGQALVFHPAPNDATDITARYNVIRDVAGGCSLSTGYGHEWFRVNIHDNLFYCTTIPIGSGNYFCLVRGDIDRCRAFWFDHNTCLSSTSNGGIYFFNGSTQYETEKPWTRNNIASHLAYGIAGTSRNGVAAIYYFATEYDFDSNALIACGDTGNYIPTDANCKNFYFPANNAAVKFTDASFERLDDFILAADSPYKGGAASGGTDGEDLGCDIDLIKAALSPTELEELNPPLSSSSTATSSSSHTWSTLTTQTSLTTTSVSTLSTQSPSSGTSQSPSTLTTTTQSSLTSVTSATAATSTQTSLTSLTSVTSLTTTSTTPTSLTSLTSETSLTTTSLTSVTSVTSLTTTSTTPTSLTTETSLTSLTTTSTTATSLTSLTSLTSETSVSTSTTETSLTSISTTSWSTTSTSKTPSTETSLTSVTSETSLSTMSATSLTSETSLTTTSVSTPTTLSTATTETSQTTTTQTSLTSETSLTSQSTSTSLSTPSTLTSLTSETSLSSSSTASESTESSLTTTTLTTASTLTSLSTSTSISTSQSATSLTSLSTSTTLSTTSLSTPSSQSTSTSISTTSLSTSSTLSTTSISSSSTSTTSLTSLTSVSSSSSISTKSSSSTKSTTSLSSSIYDAPYPITVSPAGVDSDVFSVSVSSPG